MRKIFSIFVLILLSYTLFARPTSSAAQSGDAGQLIAEVNGLRAANGLPPLEVNNALMSAAQQQSNYQASIGTWTHTGPGGSRPHDRAVAAGYGAGSQVFVSENVATGINLSTTKTVYELWQDGIHLETMLSPLYTHIGAGVGNADDWTYYTIVVGYIAGSAGSGVGSEIPLSTDDGGSNTAGPTAIAQTVLIDTAPPGADGSIQHVVQAGQFLENIALAYDIPLDDLLALNGLSAQSVIFPGDKLLIKAGSTAPPDAIRAETTPDKPVQTPEPTLVATVQKMDGTPTPAPVAMSKPALATPTVNAAELQVAPAGEKAGNLDFLLYVVIVFAIFGTGLILFGSALKRR